MPKGEMMANVFYEPEHMEYEKTDIPQISETEVLIKVKACGICGSDVSYYFGKSPLETPGGKGPLIIGHEISGEIVEVGAYVAQKGFFKPGERVTLNPPQPCNTCAMCRKTKVNLCENTSTIGVSVNGGFAEYVKVGYANVYKLPDGMSYQEGAMAEPLACACYGIQNLDVQIGDFVVVIGSGAMGIMMAQLCKLRGAGKVLVTDIEDFPLSMAKQTGADYVFNTLKKDSLYYTSDIKEKVKELTGGLYADRVIVPTSAKAAYRNAFEVSGKASTIVFFGLPGEQDIIEVPALETLTSNKTIRFSWLAPFTWNTAMKALQSGKLQLKPLITHTFSLEDTVKGIEFMHSGAKDKIKGMILLEKEG